MIDWLTEPLSWGFSLRAFLELVLIGLVGGLVGCWIVLYRLSYAAESLAHGMLPGLVVAALAGLPLLAGGAVGVIVAGALIALIYRLIPDEPDVATAVVITGLIGLGVLLAVTPETPVRVEALLFGDPLAVSPADLVVTALIGAVVLLALWRGHDRILAVGFDRGSGTATGLPATAVQLLLLTVVAVTVLVGVRGLGTLLVSAVLVAPAAAARLLTVRLGRMMLLSAGFAVLAGVAGIYLSYHLHIAAGAATVVSLVAIYLLAAGSSTLRRAGRARVAVAGTGGPAR